MDVETRDEIVEQLKEACPLLSVLRKGKPCPYFGPSVTCRDCTYAWIIVADSLGKIVRARRALYKKEAKKRRSLESELEKANQMLCAVADGAKAMFVVMKHIEGQGIDKVEEETSGGGQGEDQS